MDRMSTKRSRSRSPHGSSSGNKRDRRTMHIRSWVPVECLTKMQNIFSHHSTSFKKLVLNLVSLILYEVFSLLIFLGAIKDKRWSSKFDKSIRHQRLICRSTMRRTNWEMRRTLVSTPEIIPTYDCGALLLGSVLIFYFFRKKKLKFQNKSIGSNVVLARKKFKFQTKSIGSNVVLARKKKFKFQNKSIGSNVVLASSKEDITSHLNFLIAKSVEMNQWHEASVVEMRENRRVVVFKKLLIAGDVELNPGPYPPELLARLIDDFAELKPEYYSLGVQLKIPVYIIEVIKNDTGDRLVKIFDHWLLNTREDLWFEQLHNALQKMRRSNLADIVRQKYMNKSTQATHSGRHIIDVRHTVASHSSIKPTEDRDSQKDTSMDSQESTNIDSREVTSIGGQEVASISSREGAVQFYAMDETEMRRYPEVKADTNEIISHYSTIYGGLYKWIRSNNDRIKELKDVIWRWLDIDTIKIQDSNVAKADIDDMQSIHEVWRTFSNYHSFFNFGLVERAVNLMDYKEGKDNMEKYKTVFSNYLKRKVTQCPSSIGMKGNNHKVIIVKLDKAFSGCRMEHLQLLGREICRVLEVKENIQVEGVIKGSYCVTFHLFKSAVPRGFYLMDSQLEILKDFRCLTAKILSIECGSVKYIVNEETGAVVQFYAMDETEMRRYPEIMADTNEIISHYSTICGGLYKWIKSNNDRIKELKDVIRRWLDINTIKTQDSNVAKADIDGMQSIHEVWRTFSNYHSFFNFGIVEQAIDITDYEEGKDNMKNYKTVFSNYLKRKVTQCPSSIGMKGNNHKVIIVKLDKAFSDCRMEHLQLLGRKICGVLEVKENIQVEGVIKGSYCVTFHLFKSAVPRGFYLMDNQLETLKDFRCLTAKILSIECGSVKYIVNEETDEPKYGYAGGHASHKQAQHRDLLPMEVDEPTPKSLKRSHNVLPSTEVEEPTPKTTVPGHVSYTSDLLHPLAALTWQRCCGPPWWMGGRRWPRHCAALQDRVAVLAAGVGVPDVIYISSTDLHLWTENELPYALMSLTIYQSKFVLVGGLDRSTNEATNTILISTTGQQWEPSLPPMPTKRYATSSVSTTSPEVLVVTGGNGSNMEDIDVVEVLMTDQWITIDPLPTPASFMDSTVHEGNLYFMTHGDNSNTITTCSCTSLISSCIVSTSTDSPLWSQFQAPGGHRSIISCSAQLVIIDNEGTARSYSSTTQSWVEASIAGDRPYEGYRGSAATVLPTGEILYSHEAGVFRGAVSESSYSPEIEFPRNVLTRLEAVMGVQIVSVLAERHSTLTSSSGVELQPRVDDDGDEIPLPDPNKEPATYVEEVILQWSAGRSRRPPTWRQLLTVLQDMDLLQLSQQIQEFINGEFKFTSAYRHFIKTKDVITMRFLKFLFSGPPRAGKATALRRLIGEIIDLLSAGEAKLVHSSTGAVESKRDLIVRTLSITTALVADDEWCVVNNHADEACLLFQMLKQSLEIPSYSTLAIGKRGIQSLETKHVPSTSVPATGNMDTRIMETATTTSFTTATAQQQLLKSDTSSGKPKTTLPKLSLSTPPNDIPVVVELFKKASAQPQFAESMQHFFKAYLRIEDTGGQPELMDMLPALTISPGLYLLFFNLEWNLKKEFKVYYQHSSGKATTPEESKITLEEMLLSTLSSISCSCAPANSLKDEEACNSELHDILESSKSVAYFVGTHKDKVSEEQISQLDKELLGIIRDTDFFEKDLVQFCSEDRLIVAINNMDGGVEEVETIKKMLNQAMERHFKPLSIPAVWLLLNLCLRMNKDRTASMKSVLELSSQFNMSAYETKVALWFLHHHAGVMMYFPNVPLLEDLVILDTQVVYDSVNCLLVRAMSFDNVGKYCLDKFKETGQFVLKDLVAAVDRVSGGDLIPPKKLIALLKFLHIIAPISGDQYTHSTAEEQDVVYLMPCVLPTASKHQLDTIFSAAGRPLHVAPLMVRYKCGFVPLGIFPALIASLIFNKSFSLVQKGMMKNKVQFLHQPLKSLVSFLCYPRFYAIVISQLFVSECDVHKECAAIRQQVVAALEQVGSRMNYGNFVDYQFAFECPSHPGKKHLCVVDEQHEVTKLMECLEYHYDRQPKMGCAHTVWWSEPKLEFPVSVAASIKPASTIEVLGSAGSTSSNIIIIKDEFKAKQLNLLNVKKALRYVPCDQYVDVGLALGVDFSKIKEFEKSHPKHVEMVWNEILQSWLDSSSSHTWASLAQTLTDNDFPHFAQNFSL